MRTTVTTALAALASLALLGPWGPATSPAAAAAVEETRVRPGALPQGAAPAVPVIDGRTLVHGDLRLRVPGRWPYLVGQSGTAYVVSSSTRAGEQRVLRLERDGSHRVLLERTRGSLVLGDGGSRLVESRPRGAGSTQVVLDTATGAVLHRRTWAQHLTAVGADADEVVLGGTGPARTIVWKPAQDTTKRLTNRRAYLADLATGRLATWTADPYEGGCTIVSTLTAPDEVLWKSCRERVVAFSPTGRMATVHKLSDGIGPAEVTARRAGGSARARYTVDGWFGAIAWESGRSLLMEAVGSRTTANVRCEPQGCERVTPARPTRSDLAG